MDDGSNKLKKKYPNILLTSCALKNSDDSCVTRMAFSRLMYLDCKNKHINVLLSIQAIGLVYLLFTFELYIYFKIQSFCQGQPQTFFTEKCLSCLEIIIGRVFVYTVCIKHVNIW